MSLRGGSDACQTVSSPLVSAGLVGGSQGVVNKKKVAYIAGCLLSVLEIKLHRSRWTPATWGSIAILCDCPLCHRID